jgi:hypothetical protein
MSCEGEVPFEEEVLRGEVPVEEEIPFEEVLCEGEVLSEEEPFEEEVPCVQSFGKLRGWCVKNQNKLDKHYIYKEEVLPKYSEPVIKKIPPFSKKYKSKFKYSATGTECLGIAPLGYTYKTPTEEFLQHRIGTVCFSEKEYIGNRSQQKKLFFERSPTVEYEYKPHWNFSYVPAPVGLFSLLDIVKFQKQDLAQERKSRLTNVYQYLRSTEKWDPDIVAEIHDTPVRPYNSTSISEHLVPVPANCSISEYAQSDLAFWRQVEGEEV